MSSNSYASKDIPPAQPDKPPQKMVVKVGGSILKTKESLKMIVDQISHLCAQGHKMTIVHGAGPQITETLTSRGVEVKFINGMRVTNEETLAVVCESLGETNASIVKALRSSDLPAVAVHAAPDLFDCTKKQAKLPSGEPVDLGWVGEIQTTNLSCFDKHADSIPVVSPIGSDGHSNKYNINADNAAFAIAVAMKADWLVFVSDVPGVLAEYTDSSSVIPFLDRDDVERLIEQKKVSAGMIPKLTNSMDAVEAGVSYVSIISGTVSDSLTDLIAGKSIGTTLTNAKPVTSN